MSLLILLGWSSGKAVACSCVQPPPPDKALTEAGAVFAGRVVTIESVADSEGFPMSKVTLAVRRAWKGVSGSRAVVYTAESSAACGYFFRKGEAYLVYASKTDEGLGASLCSRTSPLAAADEDLENLEYLSSIPPLGTWGARHIRLELGLDGGKVELDCAHGTIGPVNLNDRGAFETVGELVQEHGGPTRPGQPEIKHAVRYEGRIDTGAGTMALTIRRADTGNAVGSYTLKHGSSGLLFKCL